MSREVVQTVLGNVARSAGQLLKSVPRPVPSVRVVEVTDGVVVMVSVCPAGERLPTLRAESRATPAELKLAPRTRAVLGAVRELRAAAPNGHLGPREIHAHLDAADPIGESTVGHALTELVRLGLLARSKEKGYELPRTTLPADAGSTAAG